MGRSEVRGLLTPMNGRIVGCYGKACGYISNYCKYIIEIILSDTKFGCAGREDSYMSKHS